MTSDRDRIRQEITDTISKRSLSDLSKISRLLYRSKNVHQSFPEIIAKRSRERKTLTVATISSTATVLEEGDLELKEDAKRRYKIFITNNDAARQAQQNEFLEDLRIAVQNKADLICFNELAYPTPSDPSSDASFLRRIFGELNASAKNIILIAGTYHDPEDFSNQSPIIFKKDGDYTVKLHPKLSSATKIGEFISTPVDSGIIYYKTPFGKMCVLVCFDAYDPSIFLRMMIKNAEKTDEEKISLIVVPSYAGSTRQMVDACKDLSWATRSIVVYVNCADAQPYRRVFVAGQQMPVPKSRSGKEATLPEAGYKSLTISGRIQLHTFELAKFHEIREQAQLNFSATTRYLLGEEEQALVLPVRK